MDLCQMKNIYNIFYNNNYLYFYINIYIKILFTYKQKFAYG